MKTLKEYRPGEKGTVKKISAEGKLKRRIFDMGITPGAEITMRKAAPLGDPIEVTVRGYELTLRKSEAETILMEEAL
jgi:ferrous iron transport protein A